MMEAGVSWPSLRDAKQPLKKKDRPAGEVGSVSGCIAAGRVWGHSVRCPLSLLAGFGVCGARSCPCCDRF